MTARIDGPQQVQVADCCDQRSAPAEQRRANLPSPVAHPGELHDQLDRRSFVKRWTSHRLYATAKRPRRTKGIGIEIRLTGQVCAVIDQESAQIRRGHDEDRARLVAEATIQLRWLMLGGINSPPREHCQRPITGLLPWLQARR